MASNQRKIHFLYLNNLIPHITIACYRLSPVPSENFRERAIWITSTGNALKLKAVTYYSCNESSTLPSLAVSDLQCPWLLKCLFSTPAFPAAVASPEPWLCSPNTERSVTFLNNSLVTFLILVYDSFPSIKACFFALMGLTNHVDNMNTV